jgi:hypothetical protein
VSAKAKEAPKVAAETGKVVAHFEDWFAAERYTALCGKRLIGVPAPPETEKCVVCLDLLEEYFGGKP